MDPWCAAVFGFPACAFHIHKVFLDSCVARSGHVVGRTALRVFFGLYQLFGPAGTAGNRLNTGLRICAMFVVARATTNKALVAAVSARRADCLWVFVWGASAAALASRWRCGSAEPTTADGTPLGPGLMGRVCGV